MVLDFGYDFYNGCNSCNKNINYRRDRMRKKLKVLDVVVDIIIILAFILAVYWFFQLMFGSTPGLSEFNSLLIIMIGGILFKLYRETGEVGVEMKYLSRDVKGSFIKVREDMNILKTDMNLIKKMISSFSVSQTLKKKSSR